MLDIKYIRDNLDLVRAGAKKKHFTCDLDRLLAVDDERRKKTPANRDDSTRSTSSLREIAKAEATKKKRVVGNMKKLPSNSACLKKRSAD